MRLALNLESSLSKFPPSNSGARFVRRSLVGRGLDFPCTFSLREKLTIDQTPVVTVIGKAFWDIGHAPKDGSNRRKRLPDYAVWEIHPAMKLTVQ
jgi:hypothetical protein